MNFEINPNLMQARFRTAEGIDFYTKEGFEQLSKEVKLLQEKKNYYQQTTHQKRMRKLQLTQQINLFHQVSLP